MHEIRSLELVPTADLLDEVLRRYDVAIFLGGEARRDFTAITRVTGSALGVLGLLRLAEHQVIADMQAGSEEPIEEEP